MGLSDEELAFYDALTRPEAVNSNRFFIILFSFQRICSIFDVGIVSTKLMFNRIVRKSARE
jgi:hypothetical protein